MIDKEYEIVEKRKNLLCVSSLCIGSCNLDYVTWLTGVIILETQIEACGVHSLGGSVGSKQP